jgi:hypothetical protein
MALHLKEQVLIYGQQNLVSLVNSAGYEKPIKDAYERHISQVCTIAFVFSRTKPLVGQST